MLKKALKKHAEKLRFAIVGGINTLIDFVVLFVLVNFGLPIIISNFISTSIALIFSFFANQKYTFQSSNKFNSSKFAIFLIITLFGLWVLQPLIINFVSSLLISYSFDKNINLLISKLFATLVTLVWNYLLYRRFVFKKDNK